jgi:hypothetical protein
MFVFLLALPYYRLVTPVQLSHKEPQNQERMERGMAGRKEVRMEERKGWMDGWMNGRDRREARRKEGRKERRKGWKEGRHGKAKDGKKEGWKERMKGRENEAEKPLFGSHEQGGIYMKIYPPINKGVSSATGR